MPNLEQTAVTAWLTELRPDAAVSEWPPAIRPVETEAALPERLVALGAAILLGIGGITKSSRWCPRLHTS